MPANLAKRIWNVCCLLGSGDLLWQEYRCAAINEQQTAANVENFHPPQLSKAISTGGSAAQKQPTFRYVHRKQLHGEECGFCACMSK